jgi:hypothetical protein
VSKGARVRRTRVKDEGAKWERRESLPKRTSRGLRNRSKYRPGVNVPGYRRVEGGAR